MRIDRITKEPGKTIISCDVSSAREIMQKAIIKSPSPKIMLLSIIEKSIKSNLRTSDGPILRKTSQDIFYNFFGL